MLKSAFVLSRFLAVLIFFFPGAAAAQSPTCERDCVATHNAAVNACLRLIPRDTEQFRQCVREAELNFKNCLLGCLPHPTSP